MTGHELDEVVSLYGETSYLLNQLLRSLYEKRREGTWERAIREESPAYDVQPPASEEDLSL